MWEEMSYNKYQSCSQRERLRSEIMSDFYIDNNIKPSYDEFGADDYSDESRA